ncbi:MAG TPA: hypothetical protein VMU73_09480 [Gaiellaceae bacterium]|nr:hypothetical protein [Gaiellaceae bacterium]
MFRSRLLSIAWIVIGVALAAERHYLNHFSTWRQVLGAVLAILLWPLLLLGISLHIHP